MPSPAAARPACCSSAPPSTRLTLAFSVIGTLASVFVVSTLERLAAARASAERAQRVAAEAQLRLLQSQLEPHMLFNTLANLRVLIGAGPGARTGHARPPDRLPARHAAAHRAPTQHPLADEFARLADYLALMAVRMGPRLQVQLDLPDELARLPVPPLLLQPLVENSIKHGLEPQVDGGRIDSHGATRRPAAGARRCATPASGLARCGHRHRQRLRPGAGARAPGHAATAAAPR